MSIFKSAVRRILVRNVDRTISTATRNAAYNAADYSPKLPSYSNLIKNSIWFAFLTFIIASFFIIADIHFLAYLSPLFFISRIIKPLFYDHIYGQKEEPVLVRDRRYKTGTRTQGYRLVKDINKRIDFTFEQIKISKREGIIKILLTILIIFYVHITLNSVSHRISKLSDNQVLELLKSGDTIYAKNKMTEIYIKLKDYSYFTHKGKIEISHENYSFELAFKDTLKILGAFSALDSNKKDYSEDTYVSFHSFNSKGWTYNEKTDNTSDHGVIRADSLYYVNISNVTISPFKLPNK